MLEWLIDDDNRELEDAIEAVNERMLDMLLEDSPFLAVFFCKEKSHAFLGRGSTLTSKLIVVCRLQTLEKLSHFKA